MAELEDEDHFPNDFDNLNFDNIPGLQPPTVSRGTPDVTRNATSTATGSPAQSIWSNSIEDMDSTFLAAVDALEARALGEMSRGGHSMDAQTADTPPRGVMRSLESPPVNRKGKRKADTQEDIDVRAILAGYETELTCPICCDLLVGAQVANPCGHTCCGECSHGWLTQNEYEPTCAVCRSRLSARKPLLPNFAVDNFVRQHLQALARSGLPEWQERGYRTIEWNKRVESWKKQADTRAVKEKLKETTRIRRRQTHHYEGDDYPYLPPWVIDEAMEPDEAFTRVMPRRGSRSRR